MAAAFRPAPSAQRNNVRSLALTCRAASRYPAPLRIRSSVAMRRAHPARQVWRRSRLPGECAAMCSVAAKRLAARCQPRADLIGVAIVHRCSVGILPCRSGAETMQIRVHLLASTRTILHQSFAKVGV